MKSLALKVEGDFALFTRPEGKVERVSYPILTPSAARGVLEAIMWKPEIRWQIHRIKVLKVPKFYSIMRNELDSKASVNQKNPKDYFADDHRQLRHSLMLKDVAYIIEADIYLQPETKGSIEKYRAMFRRRVEKGQCFHRPYLGTRECSAHFSFPSEKDEPIDWTDELGNMFFDYRYPHTDQVTIPFFFDARVENGVMTIPDYLYKEVNR